MVLIVSVHSLKEVARKQTGRQLVDALLKREAG